MKDAEAKINVSNANLENKYSIKCDAIHAGFWVTVPLFPDLDFNKHGVAAALGKQPLHPSDKQPVRSIWKRETKLFHHIQSDLSLWEISWASAAPG